ncbi:MAG: phosphatidate cytidylyltransferase [Planctomycetia bacterium]|nr:phosphatidate cytidylyltransferase [Planctomycetia bacterium]
MCKSRVDAWWLLFGSLTCALLLGTVTTTLFFGALSFWALREYITLTPTRPADHKTLVGVFFVLTPLQFILVGINPSWFLEKFHLESYFVYSALIPSLAFLILPATVAVSGDPKFFLERIAKLQVGLLICVYSLSFAPAMMTLSLPNSRPTNSLDIKAVNLEDAALRQFGETVVQIATPETEGNDVVENLAETNQKATAHRKTKAPNVTLLFAFVLLTQISDVAQFFWSLAFPKRKIAAKVNSRKTYYGVALGALTTALFAIALWYFLPFAHWLQAAFAGVIIAMMGFAGNMTISAIKRDQNVDDYGALIDGHSGVLDRIDSLCFAAPVFFHYVRVCCGM